MCRKKKTKGALSFYLIRFQEANIYHGVACILAFLGTMNTQCSQNTILLESIRQMHAQQMSELQKPFEKVEQQGKLEMCHSFVVRYIVGCIC